MKKIFGDISFIKEKEIPFEIIDFYSKHWIGKDFVIYKNFKNKNYKISFIIYQLIYLMKNKNKVDNLDVLFICNTNLINQYKFSIFEKLNKNGYKLKTKNSSLISDIINIDFSFSIGNLIDKDLPDIIIYDRNDFNNTILEKYNMIKYGRKTIKFIAYIYNNSDISKLKNFDNFDYYDLSKISKESYKQELREKKLKRILK